MARAQDREKVVTVDLYAVLGIERNATREQIRAAYRKMSKKHHPDMKTGNAEKFGEIALAHEVLTDDEARAHYDTTGEIKGKRPEGNAEAEMYDFIAQLMMGVIENISDVTRSNIKSGMQQGLHQNQQAAKSEHRKHAKKVEKLQLVEKRMKRKKKKADGDILGLLLRSQIQQHEQKCAHFDQAMKMMERIEKMLEDYDYEIDSPDSPLHRQLSGGWYNTNPG